MGKENATIAGLAVCLSYSHPVQRYLLRCWTLLFLRCNSNGFPGSDSIWGCSVLSITSKCPMSPSRSGASRSSTDSFKKKTTPETFSGYVIRLWKPVLYSLNPFAAPKSYINFHGISLDPNDFSEIKFKPHIVMSCSIPGTLITAQNC